MRSGFLALCLLACTTFADPVSAVVVTEDFEAFGDGESITNQIAGASFSNAQALTAGIGLNEFEFPPRSGSSVIGDIGAPIEILFSTSVSSISAYFTYFTSLVLEAYDAASNLVATGNSAFDVNTALSGDAGSTPNELIEMIYSAGIKRLVISGAASGSSFSLDDLSFTTVGSNPTPEPSLPLLLSLMAAAGLHICGRKPTHIHSVALYRKL